MVKPKIKGYPACAGIDPSPQALQVARVWLPRMRGDRPCCAEAGSRTRSATPHARGSTLTNPQRHLLHTGYPACAGIDPPARCRGAPHARGSTSA